MRRKKEEKREKERERERELISLEKQNFARFSRFRRFFLRQIAGEHYSELQLRFLISVWCIPLKLQGTNTDEGTDEFKGSVCVSEQNTYADWYYTIISLRFFFLLLHHATRYGTRLSVVPLITSDHPPPFSRPSFSILARFFPVHFRDDSKFTDEVNDRNGSKGIAGRAFGQLRI